MKRRSRETQPLGLPSTRLVVPVLSPTGGAGRSTLTHLLASRFASEARTLVLDTAAASLASPWPHWLTRPGSGAASLPRKAPQSAQQLYAASSVVSAEAGVAFSVLTDTRPACLGQEPILGLDTPHDIIAAYGARVTVLDTGMPLLSVWSETTDAGACDPVGWLTRSGAVPVLCAAATAKGITDALTTVTALEEADIPTERIHVVVVGISADNLPRRVQAGLTLLEPRVAGVVRIPHQPSLLATNRPSLSRASRSLRSAVDELARRVCATTRQAATFSPPIAANTTSEGDTDVLAHPC